MYLRQNQLSICNFHHFFTPTPCGEMLKIGGFLVLLGFRVIKNPSIVKVITIFLGLEVYTTAPVHIFK